MPTCTWYLALPAALGKPFSEPARAQVRSTNPIFASAACQPVSKYQVAVGNLPRIIERKIGSRHIKIKSLHFPPPPQKKNHEIPPLKGGILWTWVFPAERAFSLFTGAEHTHIWCSRVRKKGSLGKGVYISRKAPLTRDSRDFRALHLNRDF